MGQQGIEQAIGRMVLDRQFREAVKLDAKKALAGTGLEDSEIEGFARLNHDDFDKSVTGLDQRISKITLPFKRL